MDTDGRNLNIMKRIILFAGLLLLATSAFPQASKKIFGDLTVTQTVITDTIAENTGDAGVIVDGVTLKDGGALSITGGTNTYSLTNGTASLDIASGSILNVDANLTVESASFINQDLTTDAAPTLTGTNFVGIPNTALSTNPLARANHTGTQTLSTISDASTLTLLGGLAGGQTQIGGTGASENLTLQSTASATLGKILFGNSAHDDVNNTLNIGTTSNLGFPLGVKGTGATGATISFGVQNSSAAALFHTFDDGAIALGWAGASQPYRLFVRNPTFGSGIFISQTVVSGTSIGLNSSVTGAATLNIGIKTSATGATTNYSAQFLSGDVFGSIGSSSWAIGIVAPTTTTKFCVSANTGSVHTLLGEFRTSNDEAINTALKGTCTGSGTLNIASEFSATNGITNYGLLVTNGQVGIGTSTPVASALLEMVSTTQGFLPMRMTPAQRDAIGTPATGLTLYDNINNAPNFFNGTAWKKPVFTPANTLSIIGGIPFVIATGEVEADANLRWDNTNKRLGLGTAVPNAVLDVRGVGGASVGGFASGVSHITSTSAAVNANAVITGHNLFGGNKQLWYLGSTSSSNDNIAFINRQNGDLGFHTNNAVRMTIDNVGNVGIGVTPTSQKLAVQGSSPSATGDGSELIEFRDNRTTTTSAPNYVLTINRQNSSTAALYLGNDGNNDIILAGNNGDFRFGNDNSGVFTENVRITTGGNVGIGTETPDNTLDVDGFIEYDNKAIALGVAATTFAVTANGMTVTGDGGANTIATITGVTNGGFLTLIFVDGLVTITDDDSHAADSIDLSAAFTGADDTVLRLEHDGTSWYEVSRSTN